MDRATAIALLESRHSFPSDHGFHVIVRADEAHIAAVTCAIAEHRGLDSLEGRLVCVPSKQGTYVSLRLSLPCATAAEVLDVYAHLAGLRHVVRYF